MFCDFWLNKDLNLGENDVSVFCLFLSAGSELVGGASVSPDDDVFVHLAKVYSHNHASMHRGGRCDDNKPFSDGITNGYQWYPLSGQHGRVKL